jgi:hypothetical protein
VPLAANMRTGVCWKRKAATSAKVNLPRLRSRSASSKVTTGQPTRKPIEKISPSKPLAMTAALMPRKDAALM